MSTVQLLTGYGKLLLAEFKYGLEPKESFANILGDQSIPRLPYYYLKKDFFPFVYWKYMVGATVLMCSNLVSLRHVHRSRALGSVLLAGPAPLSASRWLLVDGGRCNMGFSASSLYIISLYALLRTGEESVQVF